MNYARPIGYELKTPSIYYPSVEVVENSNRNANGTLIREIIAKKVKLNMTWKEMTADELSVLSILRELGSFDCEYYDIKTQTYITKVFYCGPIQATPIKTNNGRVTHWSEITANFVEL